MENKNQIKQIEEKQKSEKVATMKCEDVSLSVKHCIAICNFIKNKSPQKAIAMLEEVIKEKKAVPMKGEIPHRKGMSRGMPAGRYPKKASKFFIKVLKNLIANAAVKNMNINNLVVFARASKGSTATHPGWRRRRFKRAHIFIEAKEK